MSEGLCNERDCPQHGTVHTHDAPQIKTMPATDPEGWCDWVEPVMKGYLMQCCDCGLVHEMEFNIADTENGIPMSEPRVEFRMRRAMPEKKRTTGMSDAERLDWLFSDLNDLAILEKLHRIADAHAMGGGYALLRGTTPIRMGDFRAAIDHARTTWRKL